MTGPGFRAVLGCALLTSSCYRYSYHQASPAEPDTRVAIDANLPYERLKWSYLWGLVGETPYSPNPAECDGRAAGRVDVLSPWYGLPLTVLSLGTVAPARVIIFCSTDAPPAKGP
jgi:hypothetical protein